MSDITKSKVQIVSENGGVIYSRDILAEDIEELSGLIDCTLDDLEGVE